MNIEGLSMALAQTSLMNNVGSKVMSMALDNMDTTGTSAINMIEKSMMERSVNPNVGCNIDLCV